MIICDHSVVFTCLSVNDSASRNNERAFTNCSEQLPFKIEEKRDLGPDPRLINILTIYTLLRLKDQYDSVVLCCLGGCCVLY